ncbi:hypothetical protein KIW84_076539 [Lathyrus oleraceus]|uniref:Uncharacterized protein n=1 Tax=Pisum sativum TaxID=3888 RepID=A0A9D5A1B8_PEA|nr:hypothetical protein KIW84_076539 [Pisum sativum]
MNSNEGNVVYGRKLAYLLRHNINKKVQGFRAECRKMIKTNAEIAPVYESSRRKKHLTTILLKRKTFSFSFPKDFDLTCFPGIDNMLSNLESWDVECRKRGSGICDTDEEDNDEENNYEIEANENNTPQVRPVDLLAFVPRRKRSCKKKVQKRKLAEVENDIATKSLTRPEEILENKENNVEAENVSCPLLKIEDKKTNYVVEKVVRPSEVKDNEINTEVDNVLCLPKTEDKGKNLVAGNDVCSQEMEDRKQNSEGGNASYFETMEDKAINMDVNDFSIEASLNLQDFSPEFALIISEVQPIVPVNQGVLEDMLKDCVVENDSTITKRINNHEVLPEVPEDFSEYDDLIASFLK